MRSVWVAVLVFFGAAFAFAWNDRTDLTLAMATNGFALVYLAESSFDWQQRVTRRNWRETLFERRATTTIVGKVSQMLSFLCFIGLLAIELR